MMLSGMALTAVKATGITSATRSARLRRPAPVLTLLLQTRATANGRLRGRPSRGGIDQLAFDVDCRWIERFVGDNHLAVILDF
jgi:hypothetical protein